MRNASTFGKGSGVFTCRCCGRRTRQTGRGDNEHTGNCAECYDLAGEENHLSDEGRLYGSVQYVLHLIGAVREAGGDTSSWDDIENYCLDALEEGRTH